MIVCSLFSHRSVTTVRVSVIQLESALCFIMCLSYMVCDAIEVKGRNIMVASSTVTTELSSQISLKKITKSIVVFSAILIGC